MHLPSGEQSLLSKKEIPRALVVPGIENTWGDWSRFQELLRGKIELVFSDPPPYENEQGEAWRTKRMEHHLRDAESSNSSIVLGHSFGARIAIHMLMNCSNFKAGILFNLPRNTKKPRIEMRPCTINKSYKVHDMLSPLAIDMTDPQFAEFVARHETDFIMNWDRIRAEIKILSREKDLENVKNSHLPPTLIFQAPCDPWDPDSLPQHENILIESLNKTYHYPHVSKPEVVAGIIEKWLSEQMNHPGPATVMSDAA